MLESANWDLAQGVAIYRGIEEEDHHQDLAYIVRLLGEVQFKREAYDDALKDYDRALALLNHVELTEKRRIKERG